ncbi:MAG TPA: CoA transferase, partial [Thermodesulfobacteriota bacterium]
MRTRLLEGVRVLDLSQGAAGAFAGRFLALLGARVTAVTLPGSPPAPPTLRAFLGLHKSRRRLDPERRPDRAALDALVHRSDAIVLDLPRERSRRWGLAPAQLSRAPLHPVVVEVTGLYGALPWADQPLAEVVWQAAGGWAAPNGVEGAPARIRGYPASCLAGAHVALVVAALAFRRLVTGRGGQASVSTVESVAAALEGSLSEHFASRGERASGAAEFSGRNAAGPVRGRDGTLLLCAPTDEQRQDLLHLLGAAETATPADLPGGRVDRADISPPLRRLLRDWTRDAWFHTTQAWRLPCSVFLETAELLRDPHLAARGFFRTRGGRSGPGSPWRATSRGGRPSDGAAGRAG